MSTRVQQEDVTLSNQHTWVDQTTGDAESAIMISNIGGRDVVINQIEVRGQVCPLATNVYFLAAVKGTTPDAGVTKSLPYLPVPVAAGQVGTNLFTNDLALAEGPMVLPSGGTIVIYINQPDSVGLNDVGTTIGFTVFTAQAMYYTETNVQAAPAA